MVPKVQHSGSPFPHMIRVLVTGSNPRPCMGWNKWYPHHFFWRGPVLCCYSALECCFRWVYQHKRGSQGPKGQADEMVSTTKCSPCPWTTPALLAQAQQCPSAGLTNPDCSWPQGSKGSSTLSLSHKKLPHKWVAALSAPLLCTHSVGIFRTVSMLALDYISRAGDRQWYSWVH